MPGAEACGSHSALPWEPGLASAHCACGVLQNVTGWVKGSTALQVPCTLQGSPELSPAGDISQMDWVWAQGPYQWKAKWAECDHRILINGNPYGLSVSTGSLSMEAACRSQWHNMRKTGPAIAGSVDGGRSQEPGNVSSFYLEAGKETFLP